MSSRRSRSSRETGVSRRITDDEIQELVSKLHQLLPQLENGRRNDKVSARRLVEETCNYIRSLHREVDDLSERLSQLLLQNTTSIDTSQVALLRTLLFQ